MAFHCTVWNEHWRTTLVHTSFWVCFCLATWTSRPWIADSDGCGGNPLVTFWESTDVSEDSVTACESNVFSVACLTSFGEVGISSFLSLKSDTKSSCSFKEAFWFKYSFSSVSTCHLQLVLITLGHSFSKRLLHHFFSWNCKLMWWFP